MGEQLTREMPRQSRRYLVLEKGERVIEAITVAALAFCAVYVGIAVVGNMAGFTPPDEDLLVSEAVVLVAFLPQIVLVRQRRQVSVDVLVQVFPEPLQKACDVLAAICGILTYALLGWAAWVALDRALVNGSMYVGDLELSEWPGRAMVMLGTLGGLAACVMDLFGAPKETGEPRP